MSPKTVDTPPRRRPAASRKSGKYIYRAPQRVAAESARVSAPKPARSPRRAAHTHTPARLRVPSLPASMVIKVYIASSSGSTAVSSEAGKL